MIEVMELIKFHSIQQSLASLCKDIVCGVKNWMKKKANQKRGLQYDLSDKLHFFEAKMVALELFLVDSELLQKIRPEELKNGAWTKKATKVRNFV